jgi:hypothetical protein
MPGLFFVEPIELRPLQHSNKKKAQPKWLGFLTLDERCAA